MPLNESTTQQITDWYRTYLGREPRQEGLDFWSNAASAPNANLGNIQSSFLEAAQRNGEQVRTPGLINSTPPATPTSFAPTATTTAAATPSPTATPTSSQIPASTQASTSSAASSGASPNVANWFRSSLGRDPASAGLQFWEDSVRTQGADAAYSSFLEAARRNNEQVTAPSTWQEASNYTGQGSADATTVVDEWARNSLGRDLTPAERARYDSAYNAAAARGDIQALDNLYAQFRSDNAGEVQGSLDRVAASQIGLQRPSGAVRPSENTTGTSATHLDPNALQRRIVNPNNETVSGQMNTLLREDGAWIQSNRAQGQREAAKRGLINSTMAASAGEDAAIRAALQIATPDAATYGRASDYNTALVNQASMFNAEADNAFSTQRLGINANAATQQRQIDADREARSDQAASQLAVAQLQAGTTRYTAELSANTQRYETDAVYRRTMDANRDSLVNNILMQQADNMSPDRKAALLEQLGMGTSARRNADGTTTAGTGLAGAVYVIDSVAADLQPATPQPAEAG